MEESNVSVAGIKYLLQKQGWVDIPSSGISMYPLIQEGDICSFIPLGSNEPLRKGEVILFVSHQGQLIGHRYYDTFVENGVIYYVCKGDTNISDDFPVTTSQLIGKLVCIKKKEFSTECSRFYSAVMERHCFDLP